MKSFRCRWQPLENFEEMESYTPAIAADPSMRKRLMPGAITKRFADYRRIVMRLMVVLKSYDRSLKPEILGLVITFLYVVSCSICT
jgi:hypothetical protein